MENPGENISSNEAETKEMENKKDLKIYKLKILYVVRKLKSPSSNLVLKALSYIRTRILEENNDISLFHECGGFKQLFKTLSSSDNDVLNYVLSILGNSYTKLIINDEICSEITKSDVAGKLLAILRKKNDTKVHRRLCRLIGNLAQSRKIAQDLHRVALPAALILLLDNTEDIDVQQLAIRALRWMWGSEKYHGDMLKAGTVKAVSSFLDAENEQLLKLVMKSLIVFTQPCTYQIALQLDGKKGNGYKMMVSKLGTVPITSVLIYNLSLCPYARIELSKCGIVPSIIRTFHTDGDVKLDSFLISAFCHMCRESMVRASVRNTVDGFKTVLSLLMNPSAKCFHQELLFAITHFKYDEPSLMLMVKGGLINVLLTQLGEHTKQFGVFHAEKKGVQERMQGAVPPGPHSPPSFSQYTPPRSVSPPNSPPILSDDLESAGLLFSPKYNPSDSDEDIPESPSTSTTVFKNNSENSNWFEIIPNGVDSCVLDTFCQLTYQRTPLRALGSRLAVDTLLEYMVSLRYPHFRPNYLKATKALTSIVTCKHYFNNLLEEECVLAIDRVLCRPRHNDCWECSRFRDTGRYILQQLAISAQSGLGEGEMTYRLASSSQSPLFVTTALSVPHVIRLPNMLNSLLFGHRALQCLLDTLCTRLEDSVQSLHSLFTTLDVKNPQVPILKCTSCEVSSVRHEYNITFITDDGFTVSANRQSLEHACPVFEAMFRGGFIESNLSQVHISEITADCLQYLTRLITSGEFCSCLLPEDINILLEMVHQTDRFLLPDITKKILLYVMNNRLSPNTSPKIYQWGIATGRHLQCATNVTRDVVKYILSAVDITAVGRQRAVGEIVQSGLKEEFFKEIIEIVKDGLTTYTKSYRYFPTTYSSA